ncbi:MAG: hypothetical protein ABI091_10635 [Ferruginibacter sp.]
MSKYMSSLIILFFKDGSSFSDADIFYVYQTNERWAAISVKFNVKSILQYKLKK